MSVKHPIISVTGASGAGTSTVRHTFDQIFRREGVKAAIVGGDAFHRYNREDMDAAMGDTSLPSDPAEWLASLGAGDGDDESEGDSEE